MEGVDPEDDLFQRSPRYEADEEGIVCLQGLSVGLKPGVGRKPGDELRDVEEGGLDAAP